MTLFKKRVLPILIVFLLLLLTGGFFFFKKHQAYKSPPSLDKKETSQDEVSSLIAQVGKLIELPTSEEPTIATITDINGLKDQPLFSKAKNGDKVLIYAAAKKAILYDPNLRKIVDIQIINIESSSAQITPSPSPQTLSAKIAVLNGTAVAGLASKTASSIQSKFPNVIITQKGNAVENYSTSLAIPLTDIGKAQVGVLASGLGIKSQTDLPKEESTSQNTDILVIVGSDLAK